MNKLKYLWSIAELAEHTIESPHDRARFGSRLARVREALETKPFKKQPANPSKHEA